MPPRARCSFNSDGGGWTAATRRSSTSSNRSLPGNSAGTADAPQTWLPTVLVVGRGRPGSGRSVVGIGGSARGRRGGLVTTSGRQDGARCCRGENRSGENRQDGVGPLDRVGKRQFGDEERDREPDSRRRADADELPRIGAVRTVGKTETDAGAGGEHDA